MDKHFRILGYLFIVYGILTLALILLFVYAPEVIRATPASGPAASVAIALSVIVGALFAFTGWALLTRKNWARGVAITGSIIALFNFPLGTALGIYGLWAMFSSAGQREFGSYAGPSGTTQTPV